MIEPFTASVAFAIGGLSWALVDASGVAGGVLGNVADRRIQGLGRALRDRFAGARAAPEQTDIARAVRIAQMQALERCLRGWRQTVTPQWGEPPATRAFCEAVIGFCAHQVGRCADLQVKLNLDLAEPLAATIDGLLGEHLPDAPAGLRAAAIAAFAEDCVLEELRAAPGITDVPARFVEHFRSGGATEQARFIALFGSYITQQLKENEAFRRVLWSEQIASLLGLAFDTAEIVARMEQRFGGVLAGIDAKVGELTAGQRRLEALVKDAAGSGKAAVEAIDAIRDLLRPGIPNIDAIEAERIAPLVRQILDELSKPRTIPTDLTGAVRRAIEQSEHLARELRFDEAEALLAAADRQRQAERESGARDDATLKAERARIARLRLRYRDAGAFLAEAAALVPFDRALAWRYALDSALSFYDQGRDFGDNDALRAAIAGGQAALALALRQDHPLDWATTQNNLGLMLQTLGARESGTARLEEAVQAYRAALEELTREHVPLAWATTQSNLGIALATLGARESGTARLEEAAEAFRSALEEHTRERAPLDWAATQNNLGNTLATLGERESGTARLEEAVQAYRAALEEWTRKRVPLDWAGTQNNLGSALATLGARESGTARLEEAVEAFRSALEELPRDRVPLDWATTQNNLGNALAMLGARESGTARLEEAVQAYRAALEQWTRKRVPLDWATTQNNLGSALATLGARESGTARLEEAVEAFRSALEELPRDRLPLGWAGTQNNLANALATLGARESGTARLEEAVEAFRAALEEHTRERVPFLWAQNAENLALVLEALAERTANPALGRDALALADGALGEYRPAQAEFYVEKATRLRDRLATRYPTP